MAGVDLESDCKGFRGLHGFFEDQVARTPDAIAVECGDEAISYATLDMQACGLARLLRSIGVGPEVPVGICLRRTSHLVVGLLGILKAGGAYVPLDPAYPAGRLALILADVGAGVLVTERSLLGLFPGYEGRSICLDDDPPPGDSSDGPPCRNVGPETLAYVIYTSGSTGTPKGVMVEHGNAAAFIRWTVQEFSAEELAVTLFATSVCFDLSVFELFAPLARGGRVRLVENVLSLTNPMVSDGVTLVNSVPSALNELLRHGGLAASIGAVNSGGEPLSAALADALHGQPSVRRVRDLYGPTETTVYSTCGHRVTGGPCTIGHPIAGTQVYLLDDHGQPALPGGSGEIVIGGAGVSRGYWRRPDLTAERFVPDTFTRRPGGRLYRTGDRARSLPDGSLEYLGRIDHQVKIRGFRIEPGEVEAALRRHPAVEQAVVVAREDRPGDMRLVAYVVPQRSASAPPHAEIRGFLAAALPQHMIPAATVQLDRLPLTPNGKIDRTALPPPAADAERPAGEPSADLTPIESLLQTIWSEVLGRQAPGIHDDFFEVGGHSLLALRLASRASRALGRSIPIRMVFEHPTITSLAAALEARGVDAVPPLPLERIDRTDSPHPAASFGQEGLWFLDHVEGERAAYNICFSYRIRGPLDPEALRRSLEHVIRRHEPLRTTFHVVDGHPVQQIRPVDRWELPQEDLRPLSPDRRDEEMVEQSRREISDPFDLTCDLMLRARLLKLGDAEHLLLISLHHVAADGWSLDVLWREVAAGYEAACRGAVPHLPDLAVRYADFAIWRRAEFDADRLRPALAFWCRQLAGMVSLELPTDRPRRDARLCGGGRASITVGPDVLAALRELGTRSAATLHMTLLASFKVLLSRWTGQDDVAVGTPVAGRPRPELEELVGYFVNTLILRTSLAGDPTFRELLRRVRATCIDAYENQDLPFDKLVETLRPERTPGRNPLVAVIFQCRDLPQSDLTLPGLAVQREPQPEVRVRFDLEVQMWTEADTLRGELVYDADLFDAASIDRLVRRWEALLEAIAAAPDCRIAALPLLTPAERRQLLCEWNDTTVAYPGHLPLPRLFESVVDRTPEAIALVADEFPTTYRELDERANRLAHHLEANGVVPGTRVGIALARSVDYVVAVLAILKASAVYVPFGREYPPERRRALIRDAGIGLVVGRRAATAAWIDPAVVVVDQEQDAAAIAAHSAARPTAVASAEDPAYVMYTSGSTGQPKGVLIPHRGVARLVLGTDFLPWGPELRFLMLAPVAFDASTLEIWGPLLNGATLVVSTAEELDPVAVGILLARERVDCLFLTAALFNQIIDDNPSILVPVRHLMTGGEAISTRHVLRALTLLPGTRLINAYGPTETTTFATTHEIRRDAPPASGQRVPIGRPIANTRCLVLDGSRQPVPIGVAGELYVGGDGVGLGYLGDVQRTADNFVTLSCWPTPGDLWYRTGDRVRWRPDGSLDFLGRMDRQIKIRGFRIEPGEVEAALSRHPAIAQAAVVVRESGPGDRRLVAYVVARPGVEPPGHAAIREFLTAVLPAAMIPSASVPLPVLPLTPNGKLDHAALPPPPNAAAENEPPQGPDEEVIAAVFRELLHLTRFDRTADFFLLGGDSLRALDAVTRVNRQLQVSLRVGDFIRRPSVEGVAATVAALRAGVSPALPPPPSATDPVRHALFVRRLRDIASRYPRRLVMISRSGTISYDDLDIRSNRLANVLIGIGMKPGDRVRLGVGVSPETLTASFALLKIGSIIELGEFSSPSWIIVDRRPDSAANVPDERVLILDELIHAGATEWRVVPSSVDCPPSVAAESHIAFRGFRKGDFVSYGDIARLASTTRPGRALVDIVGQEATPQRLLRAVLQGRVLAVMGRSPASGVAVPSVSPQSRDIRRSGLVGFLSFVTKAVRGVGDRRSFFDDRGFLTVKRCGRGGPTIVCVGDDRPIADILRLTPPSAEVLRLNLDGIHVWPPRGYSVQDHVDCYIRLLSRRPLLRGCLVVGFSHGGAIAHALAEELSRAGPCSSRFSPGVAAFGLTDVNHAIRAWITSDPRDGEPPYLERFEHMESSLHSMRREHHWKHHSGPLSLLGGRGWFVGQAPAWRALCGGSLREIEFESDDHFAAFHHPPSIEAWRQAFLRECGLLEGAPAGTIRTLLIEPTWAQVT